MCDWQVYFIHQPDYAKHRQSCSEVKKSNDSNGSGRSGRSFRLNDFHIQSRKADSEKTGVRIFWLEVRYLIHMTMNPKSMQEKLISHVSQKEIVGPFFLILTKRRPEHESSPAVIYALSKTSNSHQAIQLHCSTKEVQHY